MSSMKQKKRNRKRSSFSLGKRGVIEVQFNWIFILIAGAIITAFFVSVVQWQKKGAEAKTNVIILTNLETILTGAKVSTSTVNPVDIPDSEIGFDCNTYFIGALNRQVRGRTIFSPDLLKGRKLITWAKPWEVPFKVTNFLYLTSPQVRYIFVYESPTVVDPLFAEIYTLVPEEINKENVTELSIGSIDDENNYKVKYIFINIDPSSTFLTNLEHMPNEDVTAVYIQESDSKVTFYKKDPSNQFTSTGFSFYLGNPSILAAIFSEDDEIYRCGMMKAFKHLDIMSEIYIRRSVELEDFYDGKSPKCKLYHDQGAGFIGDINTEANNILTNGINKLSIDEINIRIPDVEHYNDLTELWSCAMVY